MTSWTRGVTSCHRRSRRFATLSPLFTTRSRKSSPSSHRPRTCVASCVTHLRIHTAENHARFYSFFFFIRIVDLHRHFEHYPLAGVKNCERSLDIDVTTEHENQRERFAFEKRFLFFNTVLILIVSYSRRYATDTKDRRFDPPAR